MRPSARHHSEKPVLSQRGPVLVVFVESHASRVVGGAPVLHYGVDPIVLQCFDVRFEVADLPVHVVQPIRCRLVLVRFARRVGMVGRFHSVDFPFQVSDFFSCGLDLELDALNGIGGLAHGTSHVVALKKGTLRDRWTDALVISAETSFLVARVPRAVEGEAAVPSVEVCAAIRMHAKFRAGVVVPVELRRRPAVASVPLAHHVPIGGETFRLRHGGAAAEERSHAQHRGSQRGRCHGCSILADMTRCPLRPSASRSATIPRGPGMWPAPTRTNHVPGLSRSALIPAASVRFLW